MFIEHNFFIIYRVEEELAQVYQVSQDRAKSLGIDYTPLEVTLKETIESLQEKGFLMV